MNNSENRNKKYIYTLCVSMLSLFTPCRRESNAVTQKVLILHNIENMVNGFTRSKRSGKKYKLIDPSPSL